VVDAIKQAKGGFVSFTFSTKFLCGVNHILNVIAVIQIQNHRQAFMFKSRNLMSRNVITYSVFFNQRTTTPQFTPKTELTTVYTFELG
jgi:hypothetical protein